MSQPSTEYLKGAYESYRKLTTSPRFGKLQVELIEELALQVKTELESRGVTFIERGEEALAAARKMAS